MIVGLLLMFYTVAFLGAPPLPVAQSVQEPQYSQWYQSTELRQWTGFTMLGLVILSMLVSARKRIQQFQWRSFDFWRWFHIGLTGLVSLILVAHTGLDTGSNLNQWLLLNFLAVLFLGGIAASSAALESALPRMRWKTWKRRLTRLHLIMVWPLPALLAYHILSVYFF
jgi:nitrite reductase (NADH) large subunit